jgi:hypothetical protein
VRNRCSDERCHRDDDPACGELPHTFDGSDLFRCLTGA